MCRIVNSPDIKLGQQRVPRSGMFEQEGDDIIVFSTFGQHQWSFPIFVHYIQLHVILEE